MTGEFEAMAIYAGEGAGRIRSAPAAAERLRTIVAEARADLAGDAADAPEPASPVCYASEAPDAYMGYADADELAAELNVLLEAERAGARVGAALEAQAAGSPFEAVARAVHGDEIRWCRALMDALRGLGATPSDAVGDFFGKAMAIEGLEARLAFVNRGQSWVVRRLDALLPRIRDDRLHGVLAEMRRAHQANIDWVAGMLGNG
jgi:nitronate monooxygenase